MSYYHIWTIGCQMNQADSEQLATSLERLGYQYAHEIEKADLIVLNSCVVRQSAENRVLGKLDSLKELKRLSPDTVVALAGCMVDSEVGHLRHRFPHVDLFLKPGQFNELLDLAKTRTSGPPTSFASPGLSPTAFVTKLAIC